MSKEYPVEMTHTTDFENYAEGFVDGGMGASRLVRQSYAAELSRLKEERSQLLEIIYGINDVWLRAWQRELGPDATLSNDEQTQLNALNTRARSFLKENSNG